MRPSDCNAALGSTTSGQRKALPGRNDFDARHCGQVTGDRRISPSLGEPVSTAPHTAFRHFSDEAALLHQPRDALATDVLARLAEVVKHARARLRAARALRACQVPCPPNDHAFSGGAQAPPVQRAG
jgi:hypothetical protein